MDRVQLALAKVSGFHADNGSRAVAPQPSPRISEHQVRICADDTNERRDIAAGAVTEALGRVGLPAAVSELAGRDWDAVVVGGGHNGLTAAAYLAGDGKSVLVLERREVLGGACTLERPFQDERFLVSPCAYVVGLLDQRVVRELELGRRGYRVFPADPQLWCPFEDGSSFAEFLDPSKTSEHLSANGFPRDEIEGLLAYEDVFDRLRLALRKGERDTWVGSSPGREELERLLGGDPELISILFEESIAETAERYLSDGRLRDAVCGQGVIGVWAGPRDPGTASVRLMHAQGDLEATGPNWGYVEGGMGRVSFAIADAALEAGAALAAGVPVARVLPGEGVELESGERIRARAIVCNADPKRLLGMLEAETVPDDYRDRLARWEVRSPVVKLNAALTRMPRFTAADGVEPQRAMVTITPGVEAMQDAFEACRRGEPAIGFCELYFQTAYDPSVAPSGRETMSAFCQYAPYELAEGDWEGRRDEVASMVLDAIAVHAPDLRECVEEVELLAPPDIESRIGLSGGNIFQGEVLPGQMWDRRLDHRTPLEGLYLCGAATHPAGSVIGLNGRNAAMAALEDLEPP